MRILLIGDLQNSPEETAYLRAEIQKLNVLNPDLAILMGDIGGPRIGTREGLEDARELAGLLNCPSHAILGNHDTEYYLDDTVPHNAPADYISVFGHAPHRAIECEGVLLLCLSVEEQPREGMRTVYTNRIPEEQFQWAVQELEAHKGMPTLLLSHAPMPGNGLHCERPMHGTAGTYLDQSFEAARWPALFREYPQIKACCSAHFHMGQHYENSITESDGVLHISTGVILDNRDSKRHSRILDITKDRKLLISTFDHDTGELVQNAILDLTGKENPSGAIRPNPRGEMCLNEDRPSAIWKCGEYGRHYIATEAGLLWEFEDALNDFTELLTYSKKAESLSLAGNRLYVSCSDGCFSVDMDSPDRFDMMYGLYQQEATAEDHAEGIPLPKVPFTTNISQNMLYVRFM